MQTLGLFCKAKIIARVQNCLVDSRQMVVHKANHMLFVWAYLQKAVLLYLFFSCVVSVPSSSSNYSREFEI